MSKFVTLDSVTAEAKSILKTATDKDRLIFQQWVYRALREIGPGKQNVDICRLYAKDFSFKKPDDMHSAIDVGLFRADGSEVPYRYQAGKKRIHTRRTRFAREGLYDNVDVNKIDLSEDDYYFHISTDVNASISYADVRYFKMPVDEDGMPMIPEDQVFAIMMFIRYMWMMRENGPMNSIMESKQTWLQERDRAKSRNKMPSMLEGTQIAIEWMSMIPNMKFKKF